MSRRDEPVFHRDEFELFGAVARFDDPGALLKAAEGVRKAGYERFDAHSPFPIHGIDEAMGMRRSRLPWVVLIAGATGCVSGYLLQWYTSAVDYRLIIAGKPYNSIEAWAPVCFELTILLSAFAAVFGMLAWNGLPRLYHPLVRHAPFARMTNDAFFLSVEAADPRFDRVGTVELLTSLGGREVALVEG